MVHASNIQEEEEMNFESPGITSSNHFYKQLPDLFLNKLSAVILSPQGFFCLIFMISRMFLKLWCHTGCQYIIDILILYNHLSQQKLQWSNPFLIRVNIGRHFIICHCICYTTPIWVKQSTFHISIMSLDHVYQVSYSSLQYYWSYIPTSDSTPNSWKCQIWTKFQFPAALAAV